MCPNEPMTNETNLATDEQGTTEQVSQHQPPPTPDSLVEELAQHIAAMFDEQFKNTP